MQTSTPFKWRHFQADIILLCSRWYLRYPLSYRDLEEIMLERGLHVDHTTIYRWVQHYAPELEKRCRAHLKVTNGSWRVDETYVKVKKELKLEELMPDTGELRQSKYLNHGYRFSTEEATGTQRYRDDGRNHDHGEGISCGAFSKRYERPVTQA